MLTTKQAVWLGALAGSTIGGFVPDLWGAGMLSFSGLLFSSLGAIAGIYIGFKLAQ